MLATKGTVNTGCEGRVARWRERREIMEEGWGRSVGEWLFCYFK